MLDRRHFLSIAGGSVLAGLGNSSTGSSVAEEMQGSANVSQPGLKQNLILFMPDEMRADSLACYGNPVTHTPNFDRLARDGFRFDQAHAQFPVCGASRCALLTGWPTSVRGHRSLYYFLRPEEPNLFRYLRQAGYDVFWFGKNDALASQTFYESVSEWKNLGYAAAGRASPPNLTPHATTMLFGPVGDRTETNDYKHLQMAIDVLNRKETDRPFCIFLPLTQPHPPYTAPRDFYDLYSESLIPELIPPDLPNKPDFHARIRDTYGLKGVSQKTLRKVRAVYYGQVSYSDWLLGELMEALEKSGHVKDTALFVTSDHGDYAGDYGLIEKWPSGLEDCLTHVPLLGRIPGGKPGVVGNEIVEMYDLMQTSLDIAGTTAKHTHFSRSLLPQIFGATGDVNRAAFAEGGYNVYEPQCFEPTGTAAGLYSAKIRLQNEEPITVSRSAMVRTKTHKLILRTQGMSELYNLKQDPQEKQNLYEVASASSHRTYLETRLLHQYLNTTGIAPHDKDPREPPPFNPIPNLAAPAWQTEILDKSK